jgi:hypothetical protein
MSDRPSRRARLRLIAAYLATLAPDAPAVQFCTLAGKPLTGPLPLVRAAPADDEGDGRPPPGGTPAEAGAGTPPDDTPSLLVAGAVKAPGGTRKRICDAGGVTYTPYVGRVFRELVRSGRLVQDPTPDGAAKRYRAP